MTTHRFTQTSRPIRAAVVAFAATTLAVTSGAAAHAEPVVGGDHPTGSPQLAPHHDRSAATAEATLLAALERDLGLTTAQAQRLIATQDTVVATDDALQTELGESFVGSWFDAATGTLTVAVTDAEAAEAVTAAGAEPTVLPHSVADLTTVTDDLDALAESDPGALDGVVAWRVDMEANEVVVTVLADQVETATSVTDQYDSVVRVETTDHAPSLTQSPPYLDGALPFANSPNVCLTGFNLRNPNTGQGYVLTAGHCVSVGTTVYVFNQSVGPVVHTAFPGGGDYALIQVSNPAWIQGPWVWTYPGAFTIQGSAIATIGSPLCTSGPTTGLTCGTITATGVSVNFGGTVVTNLVQHSACVRQGSSGGPVFTTNGYAVGTITGAQLSGGNCVNPPVSWFYPTSGPGGSLTTYQALFNAVLW